MGNISTVRSEILISICRIKVLNQNTLCIEIVKCVDITIIPCIPPKELSSARHYRLLAFGVAY